MASPRDVVGGHVSHKRDGLRPANLELAHVADVEQTDARADRHVLGRDARRILDRHEIAGKGHHLGAERDVDVRQRRAPERSARAWAGAVARAWRCRTWSRRGSGSGLLRLDSRRPVTSRPAARGCAWGDGRAIVAGARTRCPRRRTVPTTSNMPRRRAPERSQDSSQQHRRGVLGPGLDGGEVRRDPAPSCRRLGALVREQAQLLTTRLGAAGARECPGAEATRARRELLGFELAGALPARAVSTVSGSPASRPTSIP